MKDTTEIDAAEFRLWWEVNERKLSRRLRRIVAFGEVALYICAILLGIMLSPILTRFQIYKYKHGKGNNCKSK